MTTRDILNSIVREINGIEPKVGRVYHTRRSKFDPKDVATDVTFREPSFEDAEIVKLFIVSPGELREIIATTGRDGYSTAARVVRVTGMVSVHDQHPSDWLLADTLENIRNALRKLGRLKDGAGATTETYSLRDFVEGEIVAGARVHDALCFAGDLTFTVQRRIRVLSP